MQFRPQPNNKHYQSSRVFIPSELSIKNQFYSILITQYFFRGDHIVPNFEEIWPSKKGGKNSKPMRGMEYYLDAMENGPQLSGIFMKMLILVKRF